MNRLPGQRDKYKPYIRLMRKSDRSDDFRTSMRLALFDGLRHKRNVYVMVQKGFKSNVTMVGFEQARNQEYDSCGGR